MNRFTDATYTFASPQSSDPLTCVVYPLCAASGGTYCMGFTSCTDLSNPACKVGRTKHKATVPVAGHGVRRVDTSLALSFLLKLPENDPSEWLTSSCWTGYGWQGLR